MTENNTVSPALGAETQEQTDRYKRIRQGIVSDLKTARVLCHIIGTHEDTQNAVKHRLREVVHNEPTSEQLRSDVGLSEALLHTVLGSDLIIDQITEVIYGLQENLLQKRKLQTK